MINPKNVSKQKKSSVRRISPPRRAREIPIEFFTKRGNHFIRLKSGAPIRVKDLKMFGAAKLLLDRFSSAPESEASQKIKKITYLLETYLAPKTGSEIREIIRKTIISFAAFDFLNQMVRASAYKPMTSYGAEVEKQSKVEGSRFRRFKSRAVELKPPEETGFSERFVQRAESIKSGAAVESTDRAYKKFQNLSRELDTFNPPSTYIPISRAGLEEEINKSNEILKHRQFITKSIEREVNLKISDIKEDIARYYELRARAKAEGKSKRFSAALAKLKKQIDKKFIRDLEEGRRLTFEEIKELASELEKKKKQE